MGRADVHKKEDEGAGASGEGLRLGRTRAQSAAVSAVHRMSDRAFAQSGQQPEPRGSVSPRSAGGAT